MPARVCESAALARSTGRKFGGNGAAVLKAMSVRFCAAPGAA